MRCLHAPRAAIMLAPRCAIRMSEIEDIEQRLESVLKSEADLFESVTEGVTVFRQSVQDALPKLSIPTLPAAYQLGDSIVELRIVISQILLQERFVAILLLSAAALVALVAGLTVGAAVPASSSSRARRQAEPGSVEEIGAVGADADDAALFRVGLSEREAARYDEGGAFGYERPEQEGEQQRRQQAAAVAPRKALGVNAGLWFELVLCILLDAAGDASLFVPINGELTDVGFSFFYAFAIELFFDWPQLAVFGFWEELLPFTDFIPTATLGWLLVVVLGRRPDSRPAAGVLSFRSKLDDELEFAPGVRPPLADRKAYLAKEPWLVPGNRLWDVDDDGE